MRDQDRQLVRPSSLVSKWFVVVAVAACGRVNFEPIGDGGTPRVCGPAYSNTAGLSSKYRTGTAKTWFEAEADCEADGGHLVVVDDMAENDFVVLSLDGDQWLGLTDHVSEGTMVWVTGDPLAFEAFKPGEPNDSAGEDCVQINDTGEWNDLRCKSVELPYVCECDLEPPQQTYCDTEEPADCGECGSMCDSICANQVCGGDSS